MGGLLEGGGEAFKKGGSWWLKGLGLTIAFGALVAGGGALFLGAGMGLAALAAVGGAVVGGWAAFTPVGAAIGAAVAGIGAIFGFGKGFQNNGARKEKKFDDEHANLVHQNQVLDQKLAAQQGMDYDNDFATTGHADRVKAQQQRTLVGAGQPR